MSMQMDAEFKKEQIGTLFAWVGAPEGFFGGGGGVQPKNRTCLALEKWGEASQATLKSWRSQRAHSSQLTILWQYPHTYSPLAVRSAAAAVAAAAACCACVRALWPGSPQMLHPCCRPCGCCWLYSCAPLWAGACVVAFPPTHFACCVCCGYCEEEQTLHHQHAHGAVYQPTHQCTNAPEEQTRLPQHKHGISNTCN
jgi:hypothetical protein